MRKAAFNSLKMTRNEDGLIKIAASRDSLIAEQGKTRNKHGNDIAQQNFKCGSSPTVNIHGVFVARTFKQAQA